MKRAIVAATAAVLMSGGLVTVSAGIAQADCPYTGCVETEPEPQIPDQVKRDKRLPITVRIDTPGSGKPKGTVKVVVFRGKASCGNAPQKRKVWQDSEKLTKKKRVAKFKTPKVENLVGDNVQTITVITRFIPGPNSSFGRSCDAETVKIRG